MHHQILLQFKRTLGQFDRWFDAAAAHAQARSFDVNVLLTARLAPDQFPLVKQVQIACDTAKLAAARLAGQDAPAHPDTEQTFDELRARVRSVIGYLESFSAQDFAGAADRVISQPRWEGKVMRGQDYLLEHAMPNFYFHAAHTYALLRHNGVGLGKRDYLGQLSLRAP